MLARELDIATGDVGGPHAALCRRAPNTMPPPTPASDLPLSRPWEVLGRASGTYGAGFMRSMGEVGRLPNDPPPPDEPSGDAGRACSRPRTVGECGPVPWEERGRGAHGFHGSGERRCPLGLARLLTAALVPLGLGLRLDGLPRPLPRLLPRQGPRPAGPPRLRAVAAVRRL